MTVSSRVTGLLAVSAVLLVGTSKGFGQDLIHAIAFGSRDLSCEVANSPGTNYTMLLHDDRNQEVIDRISYDSAKGFGYEVLYPENSPYGDRRGFGIFGPFDDSPNGRNELGDDCPEQLYDSFVGAKSFATACDAGTEGDPNAPCSDPEGLIFRIDVPNGQYQFVAAVGDVDNAHTHRILAENGGAGLPADIGNHVVLVANFDQAQFEKPTVGSVGFGDKAIPAAVGLMLADQGESPVLNVTEGYIRIHQLQGNSNDGIQGRDRNGGDMILLEVWRVGDVAVAEVPGMTFGGAMVMMSIIACLGAFVLLRRRVSPASSTN